MSDPTDSLRLAVRLFNSGYQHGHEDTVESQFALIHYSDQDTYHEERVLEILSEWESHKASVTKTPLTDAAYLKYQEDGPDRIDALLETSERLERSLLKSDYSTGWNAALAEARRQIQSLALQAGLDTQSSAAECDRIISELME